MATFNLDVYADKPITPFSLAGVPAPHRPGLAFPVIAIPSPLW